MRARPPRSGRACAAGRGPRSGRRCAHSRTASRSRAIRRPVCGPGVTLDIAVQARQEAADVVQASRPDRRAGYGCCGRGRRPARRSRGSRCRPVARTDQPRLLVVAQRARRRAALPSPVPDPHRSHLRVPFLSARSAPSAAPPSTGQDHPGRRTTRRAGQLDDRPRHLLGPPDPRQRGVGQLPGPYLRRAAPASAPVLPDGGLDRAGRDGHHPHPARRQLDRPAAGQRVQRGLRRRVDRVARPGLAGRPQVLTFTITPPLSSSGPRAARVSRTGATSWSRGAV